MATDAAAAVVCSGSWFHSRALALAASRPRAVAGRRMHPPEAAPRHCRVHAESMKCLCVSCTFVTSRNLSCPLLDNRAIPRGERRSMRLSTCPASASPSPSPSPPEAGRRADRDLERFPRLCERRRVRARTTPGAESSRPRASAASCPQLAEAGAGAGRGMGLALGRAGLALRRALDLPKVAMVRALGLRLALRAGDSAADAGGTPTSRRLSLANNSTRARAIAFCCSWVKPGGGG